MGTIGREVDDHCMIAMMMTLTTTMMTLMTMGMMKKKTLDKVTEVSALSSAVSDCLSQDILTDQAT